MRLNREFCASIIWLKNEKVCVSPWMHAANELHVRLCDAAVVETATRRKLDRRASSSHAVLYGYGGHGRPS